jgi:hypothetical protein
MWAKEADPNMILRMKASIQKALDKASDKVTAKQAKGGWPSQRVLNNLM